MKRKKQTSPNMQTAVAPILTPHTSIAIATSTNVKKTLRKKSSRPLHNRTSKQKIAEKNVSSYKTSTDFVTPRSRIERIFEEKTVMQTRARSRYLPKRRSVVTAIEHMDQASAKTPLNYPIQESTVKSTKQNNKAKQVFSKSNFHNQSEQRSAIVEQLSQSNRQVVSKSSIVSTQHSSISDDNLVEVTEVSDNSFLHGKRRLIDLQKVIKPLPIRETLLHEKITLLMKQRNKTSILSDNHKLIEDHDEFFTNNQHSSDLQTSKMSVMAEKKHSALTVEQVSETSSSNVQLQKHSKAVSSVYKNVFETFEKDDEEIDKSHEVKQSSKLSLTEESNLMVQTSSGTEEESDSIKFQDQKSSIIASTNQSVLNSNKTKETMNSFVNHELHSSMSKVNADLSLLKSAPADVETVSSSEKSLSAHSSLLQLSRSILPNVQNKDIPIQNNSEAENASESTVLVHAAHVSSMQKTRDSLSRAKFKRKAPTLNELNKIKRNRLKKAQNENLFLPRSQLKGILEHYSNIKFTKEAIDVAENSLLEFFKQLCFDMEDIADADGRATVCKSDLEQIMKSQGFITTERPLHILVEEMLPMEYRQQLISCAKSVLIDEG